MQIQIFFFFFFECNLSDLQTLEFQEVNKAWNTISNGKRLFLEYFFCIIMFSIIITIIIYHIMRYKDANSFYFAKKRKEEEVLCYLL